MAHTARLASHTPRLYGGVGSSKEVIVLQRKATADVKEGDRPRRLVRQNHERTPPAQAAVLALQRSAGNQLVLQALASGRLSAQETGVRSVARKVGTASRQCIQRNNHKPVDGWQAKMQVRQCLFAATYRQGLAGMMGTQPNPNFPDTERLKIRLTDFTTLEQWFKDLQTNDPEFSKMYPPNAFRFEVATSGSAHGQDIRDLKVSPIVWPGASGPAIFNYHIEVV
jgi:hypothetical protein